MKSKIVLTAFALLMIMSATTTFASGKNNTGTAKQTPKEKILNNFEKQLKHQQSLLSMHQKPALLFNRRLMIIMLLLLIALKEAGCILLHCMLKTT